MMHDNLGFHLRLVNLVFLYVPGSWPVFGDLIYASGVVLTHP
jgi:hypothetical protein